MKKPGALAIPAVVASMLPVLGCPLCWPSYAALLSSLGVGFLGSARYLLPLTIALLAVALVGLGASARRHGYAPLILGAVAGGAITLGKFGISSSALAYAGVALLFGAAALSLIHDRRRDRSAVCADCAARESLNAH